MAFMHIDHNPKTAKVTLPLNIILPDPGAMEEVPISKRKVLYLLHGLSDDAGAWHRYTSIETLAAAYGLVVVMPSVGRSFYIDQPNGQAFFSYLTEELPRYLEDVFGLAPRREDTYIAGNSMGGYGAFKTALLYPERFAAAASLSGVLSLGILTAVADDPRRAEFELLFGDLEKLAGSDHDPAVWLQRAAAKPDGVPRLFITVGRQDDLHPLSVQFHAACVELGVQADLDEDEGAHDWFFWDQKIRLFLARTLGPIPVPES
jgi:putative tributyrin esterase